MWCPAVASPGIVPQPTAHRRTYALAALSADSLFCPLCCWLSWSLPPDERLLTPQFVLSRLNIGRLSESPSKRMAGDVFADVLSVMRIRTFQIIVLQGIVGTLPWQVRAELPPQAGYYLTELITMPRCSIAQGGNSQRGDVFGSALGAVKSLGIIS